MGEKRKTGYLGVRVWRVLKSKLRSLEYMLSMTEFIVGLGVER